MQNLCASVGSALPNEVILTEMCALADTTSDTAAGAIALDLVNFLDEIGSTLAPEQRQLLISAGAHLVRTFRRLHPEL